MLCLSWFVEAIFIFWCVVRRNKFIIDLYDLCNMSAVSCDNYLIEVDTFRMKSTRFFLFGWLRHKGSISVLTNIKQTLWCIFVHSILLLLKRCLKFDPKIPCCWLHSKTGICLAFDWLLLGFEDLRNSQRDCIHIPVELCHLNGSFCVKSLMWQRVEESGQREICLLRSLWHHLSIDCHQIWHTNPELFLEKKKYWKKNCRHN